MTVYYYETKSGHGKFTAKTDDEAESKVPKPYLMLYKENDITEDGFPFIIVGENNE